MVKWITCWKKSCWRWKLHVILATAASDLAKTTIFQPFCFPFLTRLRAKKAKKRSGVPKFSASWMPVGDTWGSPFAACPAWHFPFPHGSVHYAGSNLGWIRAVGCFGVKIRWSSWNSCCASCIPKTSPVHRSSWNLLVSSFLASASATCNLLCHRIAPYESARKTFFAWFNFHVHFGKQTNTRNGFRYTK